MSFVTKNEQDRMIEAARVERAKRETIAAVYAERPELVPCMANDGQIVDTCRYWAGYNESVLPSKAIFDQALSENPEHIKTFVRRPVAKQAESLIDQIMAALQSTNDPSWKVAHNVATERKKLSFWTLDALRARLAQVLEAQRLQKLSSGEIRSELASQRAAQQPGKVVLPASITREMIHAMRSAEIRKLIRDFSADAVNNRLFQRG
jgi:hypothetical protein